MKKIVKKCSRGFLGIVMAAAMFAPLFAQASLSPVLDRDNLYKIKNTNDSVWATQATAKPGETMKFMVHVHNKVVDTTANDVRVKATLPTNEVQSYTSVGTVTASNASAVSANVSFQLSETAKVAYVPGSTKLIDHNHVTTSLPDGVTSGGVGVLVGNINGCWEYEKWVTFEAKVIAVEKPVQKIQIIKFNDANGNRTQDLGEANLSGWKFTITGPNGYNRTVTTNSDGKYLVSDLAVGSYTVTEVEQSGWTNTTDLSLTKEIKEGETKTFVFGNKKVTSKKPVPVTPATVEPTELPASGPAETAAMAFGSMSLTGAALAWMRSKKNLLGSFRK